MLCPACNAFAPLTPRCVRCGGDAADEGRLDDFYGPYAPYNPIDELAMGAAGSSAQPHCRHAASCPQCGTLFTVSVPLWPL
jgi:rRNA maturation protein Nop10